MVKETCLLKRSLCCIIEQIFGMDNHLEIELIKMKDVNLFYLHFEILKLQLRGLVQSFCEKRV